MYWSIYIVFVVILILIAITLPFIRKVREAVHDNVDGTPFYVFYAVQRYTIGESRHYREITAIEVMFYYFGYLIFSIVLSFIFSLTWPLLLFLLIIYIPIKLILDKQKQNKQQ